MSEKQTSFTVTDRRKFTLDGELRDPAAAALEEETHEIPAATPIDTLPPATPGAATDAGAALDINPDPLDEALEGDGPENEGIDDELGPIPTSQEAADQLGEYQRASEQLDLMIRSANPGAQLSPPVDFEQLVQSFYLSAAMAMGAAAEPSQKPRVDIISARQSIDMLAILVEKTKGKLNDREQKLVQTALFNLRMMFLELTGTIFAQATSAPKPGIIR